MKEMSLSKLLRMDTKRLSIHRALKNISCATPNITASMAAMVILQSGFGAHTNSSRGFSNASYYLLT